MSPWPAGATSPRRADCEAAVAEVVETWGGIDVLVNNAGITHLGLFRDTDVDVIRRVVEVNFFGAVNCTKAALPSLLERHGQIVVTSSVAGVAPLATRTGYAASKHALHGFFDSLRSEHRGDGLGVLIVCPSFVDTKIGDRALGVDGGSAPAGARTGVQTPVPPEDIADAVVDAARRDRRLLLVPREARLAVLDRPADAPALRAPHAPPHGNGVALIRAPSAIGFPGGRWRSGVGAVSQRMASWAANTTRMARMSPSPSMRFMA